MEIHQVSIDKVYDPFLGSGTTLITAQLTERICYGLEIDPRYVDVIVLRWQKSAGKVARLDLVQQLLQRRTLQTGATESANRHNARLIPSSPTRVDSVRKLPQRGIDCVVVYKVDQEIMHRMLCLGGRPSKRRFGGCDLSLSLQLSEPGDTGDEGHCQTAAAAGTKIRASG